MSDALEDTAGGMQLAQRALLALADEDEAAAVAVINAGTEAEAKQAAAYLLAIVREEVKILARNTKPRRSWQERLRAASADINDDVTVTIAAQIVHDAERNL